MKYIYTALVGIAFATPSFAQNITAEAGLSTLNQLKFKINNSISIEV